MQRIRRLCEHVYPNHALSSSGNGAWQVPLTRPKLTVVLDLDETLVHSEVSPLDATAPQRERPPEYEFVLVDSPGSEQGVRVCTWKRPGVDEFLEGLAKFARLVIFTAGTRRYADAVLDRLDPKRLIADRMYRSDCSIVQQMYLKDLLKIGSALSRTVLLDNSPRSWLLAPDNCIPVGSYYFAEVDQELAAHLSTLRSLENQDDIRPVLKETFRVRDNLEERGFDINAVWQAHTKSQEGFRPPKRIHPRGRW